MTQFDPNRLSNALNEPRDSMFDQIGRRFERNARWLMMIGWVKMIAFVAIAAFAVVRFFQTDATRAMIGWAAVFIVFSLSAGIFFVIYWLELNRNSIQRELKRLELQIAELRR